jgi:hypothetical protein
MSRSMAGRLFFCVTRKVGVVTVENTITLTTVMLESICRTSASWLSGERDFLIVRFADGAALTGCRKGRVSRRSRLQRLKAADENEPVIAALKRCATQNQVQRRVFPQPVKPSMILR